MAKYPDVEGAPDTLDIMRRLRRLEGQVRGIQKMLEEDRDCKEMITQLLAIRGAVDEIGLLLLRGELNRCLIAEEDPNNPVSVQVQQLRELLRLWMRPKSPR